MNLLFLYLLFAKTALLTFGGGYAMIPLFEEEIVTRHAFLTGEEFANLVAVAQITPGPIGLNAATFIGMTQGGLPGAFAATLGLMTPAFIITLAAAIFLKQMASSTKFETILSGIRPCVLGIIASAVVFFANTSVFTQPVQNLLHGKPVGLCWQGAVIFAAVCLIQWKWKPNILWILLFSAAAGALLLLI